jgi:hypothetical protein
MINVMYALDPDYLISAARGQGLDIPGGTAIGRCFRHAVDR